MCVSTNKAVSGLNKPFGVHMMPLCNLDARCEITGFTSSMIVVGLF